MATKLGLGAAQFGTAYGVSNPAGIVPPAEMVAILDLALAHEADLIDTAPAYGESEQALGDAGAERFKIITKTSAQTPGDVKAGFEASLKRLKLSRLYGYMFHNCADLLGPGGGQLFAALQDLKTRNLISKIGVSVYQQSEIKALIGTFDFDIIQLPLNVIDTRLAECGILETLKQKNIEIHARSAFLQGLLLMDPADIPDRLAELVPPLRIWREKVTAQGLSPLESCLIYLRDLGLIDRIIIGVTGQAQFLECVAAFKSKNTFLSSDDYQTTSKFLDPRQWSSE